MPGISLDCDHDRHADCRRKLADGTCVVSCACGCHGGGADLPPPPPAGGAS